MARKEIEKDKFRVIKISKEALWEFIYESVIDNQEEFFDVSDVARFTSHFDINFKTGDFICLLHDNGDDTSPKELQLPKEINLPLLLKKMKDTTDTLYQPKRYRDYTLDEIKAIQCGETLC